MRLALGLALLAAALLAVVSAGGSDVLAGIRMSGALPVEAEGAEAAASRPPASSPQPSALAREERRAEMLREFNEENAWKNDLALFWMPGAWRERIPHAVQTWMRCYFMVSVIYFGLGAMWVYYTQFTFGSYLFGGTEGMPTWKEEMDQVLVATKSLPLYALLPTFTEWMVEQGWTRAYSRVSDAGGLGWYVLYFAIYMAFVEYFVYWAHRLLHEVRWAYRHLHHTHHKYNTAHSMSPFAGLAFNAIDGILQASPYTFMLFFVPMHLLTHEILLFATGVWTANIHDNVHGDVRPVLGAMYHTIHHTAYKYNYGHYFTFVDRLHGTLLTPEEYDERRDARASEEDARAR